MENKLNTDKGSNLGIPNIPFIYSLTPEGYLVDFGYIPIIAGLHYTIDVAPSIDQAVGPLYQNSISTVQADGSILHTNGTWIETKVYVPPNNPPYNPAVDPAYQDDIIALQLTISNLQTTMTTKLDSMSKNTPFDLSGTSDANGLVTLNYADKNLTVIPRVTFIPVVATVSPTTVGNYFELVSSTTTSTVIRVRKMASIASVGLVPSYGGSSGIPIKAIIIPKEPTT